MAHATETTGRSRSSQSVGTDRFPADDLRIAQARSTSRRAGTQMFRLPVMLAFVAAVLSLMLHVTDAIAQLQSPQTFTSSGTFTVPPGVTSITVHCIGGGGAGGTRTTNGVAGGGGGGAYARKVISVSASQQFTVIVGAGALNGSNPGGDSWFKDVSTVLVLAKGGNSVANNLSTGASGGSDLNSVGDVKNAGGDGGNGGTYLFFLPYGGGGGGAAGMTGAGSHANNNYGGSGNSPGGAGGDGNIDNDGDGNPGSSYGGGGSGATRRDGTENGGAGAHGVVIVEWDDPLPVELVSFGATRLNDAVLLRWKTATETNNYGFDVERSLDGSSWSAIGFVAGNGTTSSEKSYTYRDMPDWQAAARGVRYRLRQIDRDGTIDYSSVVHVSAGKTVAQPLRVHPQPLATGGTATVLVTLPHAGDITLEMHDSMGRLVATFTQGMREAGTHTIATTLPQVARGVYSLRATLDGTPLAVLPLLITR